MIKNTPLLRFVQTAFASMTVNAGAAGWTEHDMGAITGTRADYLWLIIASGGGGGIVGARPTGSATDAYGWASNTATLLSRPNGAGHMDLYRNAGFNIDYMFLGYFTPVMTS